MCPSGSDPVCLQQCPHSYFCPALLEIIIVLLFQGRQVAVVSVRIQFGQPATVSTQLLLMSCTDIIVLLYQGGKVAVVSVRIQSGQPATVSQQLFLSCTDIIVLLYQGGQVAVVSVRIQSGQPATVSKQLFLSCTVRKNSCIREDR